VSAAADNAPVIIGVAQHTWRERDAARTPLDGLEAVTRAALADAAAASVIPVDAVATVPPILTQMPELAAAMPRNLGAALAARLGFEATQYVAEVGGNLPQAMLSHLADALVAGRHHVALVAGAEVLNTFLGGLRRGEGLPDWNTGVSDAAVTSIDSDAELTAETEAAHGLLREAVAAYPLFETAWRHARGLSPEAHRQHLGRMISRFSEVAAANPHAWRREVLTSQQALSTADGNRMICFPYTRCMNAILAVDMAAAVVMTTAATARELGVPRERWIYLRGAGAANDTRFIGERAQLHASPAIAAAGAASLRRAGIALEELDFLDLYSCFPSAVQIACDALGLSVDDPRGLTVTGGLTRFGGPGNNYSLHAIATLVDKLRARGVGSGMVTANGGYLTKHAIGVYSTEAPRRPWESARDAALQRELDARKHPRLVSRGEGRLRIEGYTLRFEGDAPRSGIVVGRLDDGSHCLAHTEEDATVFRELMESDAVGAIGQVTPEGEINRLRL
jgi:acetyl-CoA C-acetyltransferase